jgi:hypothetical protein
LNIALLKSTINALEVPGEWLQTHKLVETEVKTSGNRGGPSSHKVAA